MDKNAGIETGDWLFVRVQGRLNGREVSLL